MNNEIIRPEDVFEALVTGFEVLMIRKNITTRFGTNCIPLTRETFVNIEKFLEEDDSNLIYLKTEKFVKQEENEDE